MDVSPNAPKILNGALAHGITHPTGVARLKCCNRFYCGMGVLTRPGGQDAHPTRVY
ncbi:hypothetical protein H6G94_12245 [Nostoc punctiforme FACHB-252]|uniref:Uncharacterized protein n=1 Tax=Nostoc punctiforme FACHB-252 TaxID=1357509 RepID=A0ABR8H9E6_NOSPU|nr:hypothetical protein [Nostoc punctiforme FACHB-252]